MARKQKSGFTVGLKLSADLEREGEPEVSDGSPWMESLYVDVDDNISAKASCGQEVYVCTIPELPEIIAFLQDIVAAHKKR